MAPSRKPGLDQASAVLAFMASRFDAVPPNLNSGLTPLDSKNILPSLSEVVRGFQAILIPVNPSMVVTPVSLPTIKVKGVTAGTRSIRPGTGSSIRHGSATRDQDTIPARAGSGKPSMTISIDCSRTAW